MPGEIAPEELKSLLEADEEVHVVDIRAELVYERAHIPGSRNVPFHELTESIEEFRGVSRVVTVCPHGEASLQAARLIESFEGVDDSTPVESLDGGLEAWDGPMAGDESAD